MRKSLFVSIMSLVAILPFAIGQGCSGVQSTSTSVTSASGGSIGRCATPPGFSGAPASIEEAIAQINALPKPVTVACFLESLKRPLNVNLTNSVTSAQPAFSTRSPRIFIMTDPLFISVVPEGPGSEVVEFSHLGAGTLSTKGELAFPVMNNLPLTAAYDRIQLGVGTKCNFCHHNETQDMSVTEGSAYLSDAIQPFPSTKVDLGFLRSEWLKCNSLTEPKRCDILRGLFNYGEVRDKAFPSRLPTLSLF